MSVLRKKKKRKEGEREKVGGGDNWGGKEELQGKPGRKHLPAA
jgi:hypothetical protein